MLVTKEALRRIVKEEYSKMLEADVIKLPIPGSTGSDEQPVTNKSAGNHEKQNFYIKSLEIAGMVYGKEYKDYYQKNSELFKQKKDLKKQIAATASAKRPATGARVIAIRGKHPDYERGSQQYAQIEDKINKEKKDLEPRAEKKIIREISQLLFQTSDKLKSSGSETSAKYFMQTLTYPTYSSDDEFTSRKAKEAFISSFKSEASELNVNVDSNINYYYNTFISKTKQPTTDLYKGLSRAGLKVQGVKRIRNTYVDGQDKHRREEESGS